MNEVAAMKRSVIQVAIAAGLAATLCAPVASAQTPSLAGVWLVAPGEIGRAHV